MIDIRDEDVRKNFWRAFKTAKEMLRPSRESRRELVAAYTGGQGQYEGVQPNKKKTLSNLLLQTADIYTQSLAANRPRVLIETQYPQLVAFAKQFQVATNNLLEEIHFEDQLRRLVLDAFFGLGVMKVYRAPGQKEEVFNPDFPQEPEMDAPLEVWAAYQMVQSAIPQSIWVDPGKPYAECISLDDFVYDVEASSWEKIRFAGHIYRVPLSEVKEDERFDPEVVALLKPTSRWGVEFGSEEKASDLSKCSQDHDEIEPMVDLMDLWLPREQQWCVLSTNQSLPPLMVSDWDGPESGPFHILTFLDVPDNIMPVSPAANLKPLHDLDNALLRKAARGATNQKTVLTYSGDTKDAEQVAGAQDMETKRVNDPQSLREMKFNGVDQGTLAFEQIIQGLFSRMAGNLDAMGGLGPQSGTFGQDQLIAAAVSKREAKMQQRVVRVVAAVVRDLGWLLWVDKSKEMRGQYFIPGVRTPVDVSWTPEDREGDFLQYNFDVAPYSMAYQSPTERGKQLLTLLGQVYLPLMPMMIQQGGSLDIKEITSDLADLFDSPRLRRWAVFGGSPHQEMQPVGQQPGGMMAPSQPHIYQHVSTPTQGSPDSQRTTNIQALLGGGSATNSQSMAALGRTGAM